MQFNDCINFLGKRVVQKSLSTSKLILEESINLEMLVYEQMKTSQQWHRLERVEIIQVDREKGFVDVMNL